MKQVRKRLTSLLMATIMVIGLLPATTIHVHAASHFKCDNCGEVYAEIGIEADDMDDYHFDHHEKQCDNCGECYGAAEMCDEAEHHMCGGEDQHFDQGGHCLIGESDSDILECPFDQYGTGCGGIDEGYCLWCHAELDVCCTVCPLASDFEAHICPDHGECPIEAGCSAGQEIGVNISLILCSDCDHCLTYMWESVDYECEHNCPCQCEICDECYTCYTLTEPCEYCGNPCDCYCQENKCDICGMCYESDEFYDVHCNGCLGCFEGGEVLYCEDESYECPAVEGNDGLCTECAACEYCGECMWCYNSTFYEEYHCDDCGTCHVNDESNWCDEHGQCICQCDFCDECDEHLGMEQFSDGSHCDNCMSCAENESVDEIYCPYCGGCGFCEGCFEDDGYCEYCEACEGSGNLGEEHCEECGACFYADAERTECEECGENICTDCSGDVCEACGLCFDNHAEECWSCGEPCSCICDEDRCWDCDLCLNVMEPCFTCDSPCNCECEDERCWDCGLCITAAEKRYGDYECFDCGMCPCSCICDPPMNVVPATANKTMMLLQVYVQDYFDFVENVPISLMYLDSEGKVALKNCGLTTLHGEDEVPYINIYIPEGDADKYFGVRVGTYNSIYEGGEDSNGFAYDIVGVYNELERDSVAYRCYATDGLGIYEFDWAYGPHLITLELSKRMGYVGDMSLADNRGMVTLGIWPGYAEDNETWINFGEKGEFPVNSQLLLPATDTDLKNAKITFEGKLTGYRRTFFGFNDMLSSGDERGVARGLVVTLPEDIYNITVICDGYAPYTAKLQIYNHQNSELAEVSAKYVATGDFRQDDNELRQKFVAHGNYYYNSAIEDLFPNYDMNEDMEFLFMNLKISNTDTLHVKVDSHSSVKDKNIEVSVKRLGAVDRMAYRLPMVDEEGVYFYGLPKGNYVVTAQDDDGVLYTTVLYNQEKAAKDIRDKKVNTVVIGSTSVKGNVRLQFYTENTDMTPAAVLYTIKDAHDRIWYVGGNDRSKYYASGEKWKGSPTEVTVALPKLGRGEKFTVTAVAVKQNGTVDGVKADMKLQITNGLHGSASFAVANNATLTVPVKLDKLDYGTLKARLVYETEDGYKESGYDNNKAKLTYELYSESIDQVSANPGKFTPLAKIVSIPPGYSKTLIQLRDPEDGTLLDEFAERGLKPGEVERPKTGEFRTEVVFGDVAPGDYTLRVYGTGFGDKNKKNTSFYEYVTVEENQTVTANVLMGEASGSKHFEQTYTVTDAAGNPLVGALVTVVRNDAKGVPTYVDKYITNGQGKVTVSINMIDPKGVQNAYAHTVYCYARGFNAGSTPLTDTTVNGSTVKGYAVAFFGADTTTWLANSFFRWATNLESVWGKGTYYTREVLEDVGYNYYDLISNDVMVEIGEDVSGEDYGKLLKERNMLTNLEVEEKTFVLNAMSPQNVIAYTIPMNDETYTVSVPADTTLELHVEADGGVMTYNWYRKGHGQTDWVLVEDLVEDVGDIFDTKYYTGVLIFNPVNLTDHPGYYYCEVVNEAGKATSATIDVLVESIPLKGKADITGEPGIGMEVKAELDIIEKNYPDANFRYQWQKKGSNNASVDIPGAIYQTYTLPVDELGSQYRVRVTSGSYEGELISRMITSCKGSNNTHPTTFGADIILEQNKIALKGIAAGQEYVIITLGDSIDWAKAVKCTDVNNPIVFEGLTSGTTYSIYSRFYETDLKKAGSIVVSQPRLAMSESVKPKHVSFRAGSGVDFIASELVTDPTGRIYNAPVVQLSLGETIYLDYFVTPDNYTRAYYDVLFNTFNGISSDVKVTKEGGKLKIQSTGKDAGTTYLTAYRYEGGTTGSVLQIPVHEKNTAQSSAASYVNLVIKVGNLKTKTVEIEPGIGGLSVGAIDLDNYVISGEAPYYYNVVSSGRPSWLSLNTNTGLLSGTRPSNGDGTYTFTVSVEDNAGRKGSITVNVGATVANNSYIVTDAEVGNIVRPSPGANPAGIARYSHQSPCDTSKTLVKWYELNANGEKTTGVPLASTDTFKKNTKYQLEITLTAASGKKFMLHDSNTDTDYAVINNEYVDYFYPGASNGDFTKVTLYTVYDTANCITDVDLYDLLYPISGKTADVEYKFDPADRFTSLNDPTRADSIWNSGLTNGKFNGKQSDAWLYLKAKDGYWFATNSTADTSLVNAKINGEEVVVDYVNGHLYTSGGGGSNTDPSFNYNQQNELVVAKSFTKFNEITDGVFLYGYLLRDKQYLPSGGNRTTAEKPKTGGYAYYDAATKTLTLNNFTSAAVSDYYAITVIGGDLTIELIGTNKLTSGGQFGISAGNLTFKGDGKLIMNCNDYGIILDKALTMESGRVEITSECDALWMSNPGDGLTDITMNGGVLKLSVSSSYFAAIYSDDGKLNFVMNGGCLTASSEGYASGHYALSGTVNAIGSPNANGSEPIEGWNGVVSSYDQEEAFKYIQLAHTSYTEPYFTSQPKNYRDTSCTNRSTVAIFDAKMNVNAAYTWEVFAEGFSPQWMTVEKHLSYNIIKANITGYTSSSLRVECKGFDGELIFRCKAVVGTETYISEKAYMSLAHKYDTHEATTSDAYHISTCSVCGYRGQQKHTLAWNLEMTNTDYLGKMKERCIDCGWFVYKNVPAADKWAVKLHPNYAGGGEAEAHFYNIGQPHKFTSSFAAARDGYRLIGWAYDPKAKEPVFAYGEDVILGKAVSDLYAVWDHGISSIDIEITQPLGGVVPSYENAKLINAEGLEASQPRWYDATNPVPRYLNANEAFEVGKTYGVAVSIWVKGDYLINTDAVATINGEVVDNDVSDDRTMATLRSTWTIENESVSWLAATAISPKEGAAPTSKASFATDADSDPVKSYSMTYYQPTGAGNIMNEVSASEVFKADKVCRLDIKVELEDNYQFADDLKATLNGVYCTATVDPADPGKVTLQYTWDELYRNSLYIEGTVSSSGKVSVTVDNLESGKSGTLLVAQYRGDKMVAMKSCTVTKDGVYEISGFSHKSGDTYKAFLADSTWTPLCKAQELVMK